MTNDDVIGRVFGGLYRAERLLGSGGMGEVYEAVGVHDEVLGVRVALKVLSERLNDNHEMRKRFTREAEIAAKLTSPFVARLQDAGFDSLGRGWIAFELLYGEPLSARLGRAGSLPVSEVRQFVDHILRALEHAHDARVIHRDIKPGNVFITNAGEAVGEVAKVLDFGVARVSRPATTSSTTSSLTAFGAVIGTPMYMSPEQMRGAQVDHRADLYSAAVVAFRALTGVFPFEGHTIEEVAAFKQTHEALTLRKATGAAWPELLEVFFRVALARELGARPKSAGEARALFSAACDSARGVLITAPSAGGAPDADTDVVTAAGPPSSSRTAG